VCVEYHILAIGELVFIENAMFCGVIIGTFINGIMSSNSIFLTFLSTSNVNGDIIKTEAGRRLRFSFHSWNQKTDRIIVLSFLVSRLLLKLELPHYDLGLIHLNTQYSLCKLGTTEKYQK